MKTLSEHCRFGSKAQTLAALAARLRGARTLPQLSFAVADWRRDPCAVLRRLGAQAWAGQPVLVRSCASLEETANGAHAGRFRSVPAHGAQEFEGAIQAVIDSYGTYADERDEVLVQPLLTDARMSGVAVTADPCTGAPYYVVNYAEGTDTAAVTSGSGAPTQTYYHAKADPSLPGGALGQVIAACRELEQLFGSESLDVEFAVDAGEQLLILQVRRLASRPPAGACRQGDVIHRARQQLERLNERDPFLLGERTVYGVMPDWNPAEMLGVRPKPLSLSLYRYLITDTTWARQRFDYGYRDVRGHPLVVSVEGQPFIDTRASFNSLVPAALDDRVAEKLVSHCVRRLAQHPELHDKVEFEIALTGFTPDFGLRSARLRADGLLDDELQALAGSLRALTNKVLFGDDIYQAECSRLRTLAQRRAITRESRLPLRERVRWLLRDCREFGTRPFAGLARAEFLAADLLRSLEVLGELSPRQRQGVHAGARTIAWWMRSDLATLTRPQFLEKYGHLRPGTYDITSQRYDADADHYFRGSVAGTPPAEAEAEMEPVTLAQAASISSLLRSMGIQASYEELVAHAHRLIEARDQAKFAFTRSLSDALELIAAHGESLGLSRDDLAYIDIRTLLGVPDGGERETLAAAAEFGRRRFEDSLALTLPPVILGPEDASRFFVPKVQPNFITDGKVRAPVRRIDDARGVTGAIVAIPSADPGYDWIFSHCIAGLLTAYGGVNSHMAVRARALNLPAVIGAGEVLYERWASAEVLEIDSLNRQVVAL